MLKLVFLCSGGGGNLRFVAEVIRRGILLETEISEVIVDRKCPAGVYAQQNEIPVFEGDFSAQGQCEVMDRLNRIDPGVVICNIHKILSAEMVNVFHGRLLNLHYSLLPSFGGVIGARALNQALAYGARIVGTTVHWVDEKVDEGTPLVQAATGVVGHEQTGELMDVVFRMGCISLLEGLRLARGDGVTRQAMTRSVAGIADHPTLFSPSVAWFSEFDDEAFWERLRNGQ